MMNTNDRLYWWSETRIQKKPTENYGDLIGSYLYEKITGVSPVFYRKKDKKWYQSHSPYYATVGSIISHLDDKAIVWGSGIISRDGLVPQATYTAVRGPLSRKRIQDHHIDCPAVYGDPALLLPRFYSPSIKPKYRLGIIPHISELELVKEALEDREDWLIIDLNTNDVEKTTKDILSCEYIISSSLHGLIVPHAYGIPAIRVTFTHSIHGDGVKYEDYFASVALTHYTPQMIEDYSELSVDLVTNHEQSLPDQQIIAGLCDDLMDHCPFDNKYL